MQLRSSRKLNPHVPPANDLNEKQISMLDCKMRRLNNRSISSICMLLVNQIDFCNHSLTSAAKGIIDGLDILVF